MKRTENLENEICDYIREFMRAHGYPPTVRDIQNNLEIKSTSTVHSYLKKLAQEGRITKSDGKSRSVRVSNYTSPQNSVKIPVVGAVAAGVPILAEENIESYIDFPVLSSSLLSTDLFALAVRGTSMIDAGIFDGDMIIVQRVQEVENGTIVVAMVDGNDGPSATVKTFYKENGHFRLQPENKTMDPIIVDSVAIVGKVVYLIRKF